MTILCISAETWISVMATLMGVAAVFVTISPLFIDKQIKEFF